MAWATMHFAVGMGCTGAIVSAACIVFRRGWRWVPFAMTLGGVWALIPDMPRIFREDFPNAPMAWVLGDKGLDRTINEWGNLFFFHRSLDQQPQEYALLGMTIILILYNISIAGLMWLESDRRLTASSRLWQMHHPFTRRSRKRHAQSRRRRPRPGHVIHRIGDKPARRAG